VQLGQQRARVADVLTESAAGSGEIPLGKTCEYTLVVNEGSFDFFRIFDQHIHALGLVVGPEDQQALKDGTEPGIAASAEPELVQFRIENILGIAPLICV